MMCKKKLKIAYIFEIKRYLVFKSDLETASSYIGSENLDGLSFRQVDSQNINDVEKLRGENYLKVFHKFYDDGCIGVYAYIQGAIVAHAWLDINNTKSCILSAEEFILLPGEAGTFYAYIAKEYRGKHLSIHLWDYLRERVRELGGKIIIPHVNKNNEAAILSNRRSLRKDFEDTAINVKIMGGVINIYKSSDRWLLLLRLPILRKRTALVWTKSFGFQTITPNG